MIVLNYYFISLFLSLKKDQKLKYQFKIFFNIIYCVYLLYFYYYRPTKRAYFFSVD